VGQAGVVAGGSVQNGLSNDSDCGVNGFAPMDEIGIYTVKDGEIVREEFFYDQG
jgi:SnoaL-like protein